MRLLMCAVVVAWALCGCLGKTVPDRQPVTQPLPIGSEAQGDLVPGVSTRYLVRVDEPGLITLDASWSPQEGLERIEWSAPPPVGVTVFDARNMVDLERRIPVKPGFYYVEIIPWTDEGSYRLRVSFWQK